MGSGGEEAVSWKCSTHWDGGQQKTSDWITIQTSGA